MAAPKITLYVDILSPFTYQAYYITKHSPVFKDCDLSYVPVSIRGIMRASGNKPPLEVKNKIDWLMLEIYRWARLFDIPITQKPIKGFPIDTQPTQRALCVVASDIPEKLEACIDALYHSFWVEANSEVGKVENFTSILSEVLGKEAAEDIAQKSITEEGKNMLLANVDKAVAAGAFGLPWLVCTNSKGDVQAYFGVDHLGQVAEFLGLDTASDPSKGFQCVL